MYPDSPYAIPIGSFRTPQKPPTVDADKGDQIQVCFAREWLPLVLGALTQLLLEYTWRVSDPTDLDIVQQRVIGLMYLFQSARKCNAPIVLSGGADGEDNLIRQNPDNPCELQTSIDGTNWCTFADLSLCLPAPSQPARDAPQPSAGGGFECYHGTLEASSNWLVPTPVSTGDTLDLQDAIGAASDGTATWRCPDGKIYFAGACQPGTETLDGGDPDGSVFHMALIWVINGSVYLNAMSGPVTVPSGVSNGTAVLQVNDGSLAGNFGSYQITVCVTNNAETGWTHVFNFLLTSGGWTPIGGQVTGDSGQWVASVGWIGDHVQRPANNYYNQCALAITFPARTLTRVKVDFSVHGIATDGPTSAGRFAVIVNGNAYGLLLFSNTTEGDGLISDNLMTEVAATSIEIDNDSTYYALSATYGGSCGFASVEVSGLGTDPF